MLLWLINENSVFVQAVNIMYNIYLLACNYIDADECRTLMMWERIAITM